MDRIKQTRKFTSIGSRMKSNYEDRYRFYLTRRTPVIMRLDGKAFHTLTRECDKPFDDHFANTMTLTAKKLCEEIQGAKLAYIQSDEISVLITDFDKLTTEAWFDYNIQKMVSVASAIASSEFNKWFSNLKLFTYGIFDCRVFNVPTEEVVNYFVWRQKDWERNSIQMLAQSHYSHKQLHKKDTSDMHEMLHEKEINWTGLEDRWKNGSCLIKNYAKEDSGWDLLDDCPIFTIDCYRNYIENILMNFGE